MAKLKDLIKRQFDIFVKMRWLKQISKTMDRLERDKYVLNALLKAYKEEYGEDLRGGGNGRKEID